MTVVVVVSVAAPVAPRGRADVHDDGAAQAAAIAQVELRVEAIVVIAFLVRRVDAVELHERHRRVDDLGGRPARDGQVDGERRDDGARSELRREGEDEEGEETKSQNPNPKGGERGGGWGGVGG